MIYALTFLLGIVTGYLIRYFWKREKGDGVTVEFTISENTQPIYGSSFYKKAPANGQGFLDTSRTHPPT